MATFKYSGSQSGSVALNVARTVALSGGGAASGIINSVVATLNFSTNAYSNYYNVTATLNYAGGSKSSNRSVKMTASNYTSGKFDFTFDGLTVDQANSIESVTVTCSSNAEKIFLKGDQSVTVEYLTLSNTTAPTGLSLGTASAAPGARVLLSWSGAKAGENNPIKAYEVYRSTTEGGAYTLLTTVSSSATSGSTYVTAPTTNDSAYYYRVKTIGTYAGYDSDTSDDAAELTCTFASVGAPKTVDLSATNLAPGGSTDLNWYGATAGTNNAITGYEVYRADNADGPYTLLATVTSASAMGVLKVSAPATNGAAYYYKVKTIGTLDGYDSDLSSSYAMLACTYSTPTAPTVVVDGSTTVYAYPGDIVVLRWSGASAGANNEITGYSILRDGVELVSLSDPEILSYSVAAHSAAGKAYVYTVVTKGTYSNSAPSSPVYIYSFTDPTAPTTVSVSNNKPGAGARVVLSWSGAAAGSYNAISGYRVYRSTEVNGSYALVATVSSNAGSASCAVYAPSATGATYYYRVETMGAISGSGQSSAYAGVTAGEVSDGDSETTVIIRPSKREKRGMILGDYDTAAEGWTLCEWSFPAPDVVENYVEVPGRSAGPLDMTETLTRDPRYGSRPLTARFECSEGTRLERDAIIDDMVNRLNGYRREIIFPDDSTRYAVGRLTVKKDYSDMAHASVTVTGVCEPWRYNREQTVREVALLDSSSTVVLSNSGRMVVSPEVTVTGYGASVLLTCGADTWELSAGTYQLPGFTLAAYSNTLLTCTGTGTLTFTYREAIQ